MFFFAVSIQPTKSKRHCCKPTKNKRPGRGTVGVAPWAGPSVNHFSAVKLLLLFHYIIGIKLNLPKLPSYSKYLNYLEHFYAF